MSNCHVGEAVCLGLCELAVTDLADGFQQLLAALLMVFSPVMMALSQLVTAYRFADNGLGAAFVSDRIVLGAPAWQLMFFSTTS